MEPLFLVGLLAIGIAAAGYLLVRLAAEGVVRTIYADSDYQQAIKAIKRGTELGKKFLQRRQTLTHEVNRAEDRRRELTGRRRSLERDLELLRQEDGQMIRFVGEQTSRTSLFRARIFNRHVQNAIREGRRHGSLHPSWAVPQDAEVWAVDRDSAREVLMQQYPASAGFHVTTVSAVKTSLAGPSPAAAKASG